MDAIGAIERPSVLPPRVIDLGRMRYREAYELQCAKVEEVRAERESGGAERSCGFILLVEHDPPVITMTPRAGVNLVASPAALAAAGIEVQETDRGGDITYHGPGQLVVYPILDLNLLGLRLHEYMRLLEGAVIDTCASFGVNAGRDAGATGVWVATGGGEGEGRREHGDGRPPPGPLPEGGGDRSAKICAMGVRIRRWVSMHGLALNVTTDLSHFSHIVPCGLAGRPVTSLERELGAGCPEVVEVKRVLTSALAARLAANPIGTECARTPTRD